ncbi:MAG: hypothetical protein KHZ15_02585 [Coprobacillus cateniformis]|uniref:hypothetical protein n=1 Tax=Longibaculum muris TaxID=1796628 RepID=UPI003AB704D8|nr:hypothetical protein [Coprobacillus cateniformis]
MNKKDGIMDMDKKAKDILLKTYWSSSGWKNQPYTDPLDFEYAKAKGLMFDPITITHDECIKRIVEIVDTITLEQVVKAFLCSLSTRRLDYRSAIASYTIAKLFSLHPYTPVISGHFYQDGEIVKKSHTCQICRDLKYGIIGNEYYQDVDLNILNFERIKWGGVRHGELIYILFDLEQFIKEDILEPTKQDCEIFKNILKMIQTCQSNDYPSVLCEKIKDIPFFRSNKNERAMLIEIMACIGILKSGSYNRAVKSKNDWTFAEFWRGEDSYNKELVDQYFSQYLSSFKE